MSGAFLIQKTPPQKEYCGGYKFESKSRAR